MVQNDPTGDGLGAPASTGFAIAPGGATDKLPKVPRAIYVGGAGNLLVVMLDGVQVQFMSLSAGVIYPIRATQVLASGTTATGLVGLN